MTKLTQEVLADSCVHDHVKAIIRDLLERDIIDSVYNADLISRVLKSELRGN